MKVALVCIAKSEDFYIDEWIKYYKKIGFDDIFIYQNDWRWSGSSENVHKFEFDGPVKQQESYDAFIRDHNDKYDWAAFFDVDEFLVLKKHSNIKSFILDYEEYTAIGINWVLFGNNNQTTVNGDYGVIKRFTKRQKDVNSHVKSIIKLSPSIPMDIHNPKIPWVDVHKRINEGSFTKIHTDDIAQINHYFCKTQEEFQLKCDRGRPDTIEKRTMLDFDRHNFNEIEDLTLYNFFTNDNSNLLNT
jgi:hypothetical protein